MDNFSCQLLASCRMGQVCSTGVQVFGGDNGIGVMELNGNRKNNTNRQSSVTVNQFEASEEASTYEKIREFFHDFKLKKQTTLVTISITIITYLLTIYIIINYDY